MYELIQIAKNTFYIESPAKIGLYVLENGIDVYLIDSGNDKDAGKKIKKILDQHGYHLLAILNTHSNADHIGGNHYLQVQTGCDIFANGIEKAFTSHPVLEPSFLYGGFPFQDLKHKFLMAEESHVFDFSHASFPREIEVIPLPGHFFDMVGFRTPDNIIFLADSLNNDLILEKYGITFIYDIKRYIETLDKISNLSADYFVPAHCNATKDIKDLVQKNKQKIEEIKINILLILEEPSTFEEVLRRLFHAYNLKMNADQYVLVGSTVRSYLSWLKEQKMVDYQFENNQMFWKIV
ncbi:MAG: MBL fold metallo-hydrolase [Bacilli bacterium]|nr:MBL fold metallo-hydrolase [Bacilli bacterium]